MTAAPEGVPHGTIDANGRIIGWSRKPRVWRGNAPQPGWSAILSTGMIYAAEENRQWTGVRVEIRNLELFVKPRARGTSARAWCRLDQRMAPGGGLYAENFTAVALSVAGTLRQERGGGVSAPMQPGRTWHFWGNRVQLPGPLAGAFVQYEARVIPADSSTDADLARARFVGAASADYWRAVDAADLPDLVNNEDVAIARFKRLGTRWRLFTMNSNGGPATASNP